MIFKSLPRIIPFCAIQLALAMSTEVSPEEGMTISLPLETTASSFKLAYVLVSTILYL